MPKSESGNEAKRFNKVLISQFLIIGLLSAVHFPFGGNYGWSAFAGALIAALVTASVARLVYRKYSAAEPGNVVGSLYLVELIRWVLTLVGFILAFSLIESVVPWVLLGSWLLVHLVPTIILNRK